MAKRDSWKTLQAKDPEIVRRCSVCPRGQERMHAEVRFRVVESPLFLVHSIVPRDVRQAHDRRKDANSPSEKS